MRGLIAVAVFCLAGVASAGEEGRRATFDFRVIERIEEACRIGVGKAASEEEALACLRWRNGALAAIVEIAYQATLAWHSERPGFADTLESGQGRWLDGMRAMPGETRGDLEEAAERLHRRLAELMAMTA